ncbi:MAG: ABC transporter ATP-binding protein/permease [Planctomycetaceae bacterium]|jgi:ATP-binding cassette subfamily B protein/subfamily B ATP-binding cassette protein MsbA|nr:ABC transporter ATP-binding protein/permease [Planctomycetaceae bacterium]
MPGKSQYNYFRAVRETFRYKPLIFAAVFCALMISVLWGGNIAAVVYPITEICLKKDSTFLTWLDEKIQENDEKIQEIENETAKLQNTPKANVRQMTVLKKNVQNYQFRNEWYRWARPYIEKYTPKKPFQTVVYLMVIILIGTAAKLGFMITHTFLSAVIANGAAMRIREQLYQKVLRYETDYFSKQGIGSTMTRLTNDVGVLTGGLDSIYGKIVREPFKLVVCLAVAASISWQLLLLTLVIIPLAVYAVRWLAASIKRSVRKSLEETSRLFGRIEETFRAIKIVKSFTRESFERHKFHRINYANYRRQITIVKYGALTNPMIELFGIITVCLAVVVGAYLVMGERTDIWGIAMLSEPMDVGTLILFFAMLAGAADPARRLSDIFTQFQSAAAAADRVYEIIDRKVPIGDPPKPVPMPKHSQSIRFDNVSFEYEANRPVLKNISLEIPFGECTAILGASGCGKSTLINLLSRFADVTSGAVLIDGLPVTAVKLRDLLGQIGLVTQEPILFNETVLDNIRYGRAEATKEEVVEAAKQAFAHSFIEQELAQGYETVVGPGGGNLSGGQRQRIALARAFIRNPPILLLDEATSQIDIQSERMIHQALETFKQGRTVIMVTHRLSALPLADRVILMNEGRIIASGTHAELLQTSPEYARFHG